MTNRQFSIFMMWIIPLIFMVIRPFSTNDLAGWIAHGNYFLDHHEILTHDIFSVLPTRPLVYPAWGISVIYAVIYRHSDLTTVCLLHYVLMALLLGIVYSKSTVLRLPEINRFTRLSVYIFWLGAVDAFGERPSTVALIPLLLSYLEIDQIDKLSDIGAKTILKLCLLNILWVNIHGSFILLWIMFAWKSFFLILSERSEWRTSRLKNDFARLAITHLFIGLSSLVNPFSTAVYPYILETMKHSRGRLISEWSPTTPFAYFPTGALYFLLLFTVLAIAVKRAGRPRFLNFISSPFFILLLNGMSAIRNAALPFIVLLPFMKREGFGESNKAPAIHVADRKISNLLSATLFLTIFIFVLPPVKPKIARFLPPNCRDIFDDTAIPEISHQIRLSKKTCPIFNAPEVGSFLILKLSNKIFFDSRNIIYSDADFLEYLKASQAQVGWEDYLKRYQACFAVLNPQWNASLIQAMRTSGNWKQLMEEKGNLLFEKRL